MAGEVDLDSKVAAVREEVEADADSAPEDTTIPCLRLALADSQIVLELGPADTRAFAKRVLGPRDPSELPELQAAVREYRQTGE